jgi:hypothetical protein
MSPVERLPNSDSATWWAPPDLVVQVAEVVKPVLAGQEVVQVVSGRRVAQGHVAQLVQQVLADRAARLGEPAPVVHAAFLAFQDPPVLEVSVVSPGPLGHEGSRASSGRRGRKGRAGSRVS